MKTIRNFVLLLSAIPLVASTSIVASEKTTPVTEENFSHAETARNYRNWVTQGANKMFVKMPGLPPRGKAAATVQMNDDTLYGAAIVEAVDGNVTFSIPETDNYLAVQVVTERVLRFSRQAILAIFHNIVLPVSAFGDYLHGEVVIRVRY